MASCYGKGIRKIHAKLPIYEDFRLPQTHRAPFFYGESPQIVGSRREAFGKGRPTETHITKGPPCPRGLPAMSLKQRGYSCREGSCAPGRVLCPCDGISPSVVGCIWPTGLFWPAVEGEGPVLGPLLGEVSKGLIYPSLTWAITGEARFFGRGRVHLITTRPPPPDRSPVTLLRTWTLYVPVFQPTVLKVVCQRPLT